MNDSTPSCWDCFTSAFNFKKLKSVLYDQNMAQLGTRCQIWTVGFL